MSNIEEVVNLKEISERFNNGTETIEDIMNYCRNYEIKFRNGPELRVVEKRYFDKLVERIKELEEESIEYKISDTNVASIEEDIKRCEQLIKPEHANWIGISNQTAITHLIERIKKLEEENKKLKAKIDVTNWQEKTAYENLKERYIPVQKVKDKIEEIKEDKESKYFDKFLMTRDIDYAIEILEELLEDK